MRYIALCSLLIAPLAGAQEKPRALPTQEVVEEKTRGVPLTNGFRGMEWGSSATQVLANHDQQPDLQQQDMLVWSVVVAGVDAQAIFEFGPGGLNEGSYMFTEAHIGAPGRFFRDYEAVEAALIEQHGLPNETGEVWTEDTFRGDRENRGMALRLGHMQLGSVWNAANATITHLLSEISGDITHFLLYHAEAIEEERDQRTLASNASAQNKTASIETTISRHCQNEWPADYEMRAYCERQQREGVRELDQLVELHGGIPEAAFETALGGCNSDWPEDYQMMAYCLKQQIEGFNEVSRGPQSFGANLTARERNAIQSHCRGEWPNDFQMRSYCEGQQVEGLSFLENRPSSVSVNMWSRAISVCRADWRDDFQMQAYCVRRHFGW